MTITPEEALEIARFAWPENTPHFWRAMPGTSVALRYGSATPLVFDLDDLAEVHAAELAVIERGHEDQLGMAICAEIFGRVHERDAIRIVQPVYFSDAARLATAPIDARLRALLRVAREVRCWCGSGSPADYEGPLRDCPVHGERKP